MEVGKKRCVRFETGSRYIKDFVELPKKLYAENNTENPKDIRRLLEGRHPLCRYFSLYKFLVYDGDTAVGRYAITVYPEDDTAYLGFFECINDQVTAKYIFDTAKKFARKKGYRKIVGPVDASFWIKYRLKINMFDKKPYTGEPYNLNYYYDMFLRNGYRVTEHYTSNVYKTVDYTYENEKYHNRYTEFVNNGYVIRSLKMDEYDRVIEEIYYLLTELYKDFPVFKHIEKKDFTDIFSSYRMILNPSMVKLAYYDDKLTGFFISVQNYGNIVYHLNLKNILKIMRLKKSPEEFIMLYMGVDQEHRGLGKAIAYSIIEELKKSELPSIGALTKDGKITQNYVEEMIDNRYEYVLMELDIDDSNK